jgi:hypothetical protein
LILPGPTYYAYARVSTPPSTTSTPGDDQARIVRSARARARGHTAGPGASPGAFPAAAPVRAGQHTRDKGTGHAEQRQALAAILELAAEIQPWTIEKVLGKSDLQFGVDAPLGPYGSFDVGFAGADCRPPARMRSTYFRPERASPQGHQGRGFREEALGSAPRHQ